MLTVPLLVQVEMLEMWMFGLAVLLGGEEVLEGIAIDIDMDIDILLEAAPIGMSLPMYSGLWPYSATQSHSRVLLF